MVELVPAPWTNEQTRTRTREIMKEVGQVPVSLSRYTEYRPISDGSIFHRTICFLIIFFFAFFRELPGFILNRLQYAILNESWRLVSDGVVSADDLDVVMRDGLGLRYAFMGNKTISS